MASLHEHVSPLWSSVLSLQNNQSHNHNPSAQKRHTIQKRIYNYKFLERPTGKELNSGTGEVSAKRRANSTGMVAVDGSVQDTVHTRAAKRPLLTSPQHPQATSASRQFTQILAPPFTNFLGHQRRAVMWAFRKNPKLFPWRTGKC